MQLNRKNSVILILFGIVFCSLYAFIFDAKVDLNGDNANYYMLAKALQAGEGFVSINSINKTPNNHFPPGYPAMLSVLFFLTDSFEAAKVLNGCLLFFSLLIGFLLVRKIANDQVAWVSLVFLLLNSHLLKFSTIIMTEIPFLFFSLLSFWFFLKAREKEKVDIRNYALAFLFFIVAFYMRTLGIAILAAYGLVLLLSWKSSWKILMAYTLGFVVCYIPWFLRGQSLGGNSYLKQLVMINPYRPELGEAGVGDFISRFFNNAGRYVSREIPEVLFPYKTFNYKEPVTGMEWVIGILVLGCVLYGIFKLEKHRKLIIGYMGATFVVLLLWPNVWVGIRFVLPMLPFLVLFFVNGFVSLLSYIPGGKKIPAWVILVLALPGWSEIQSLNARARLPYEPKWDNYFTVAKAIKKQQKKNLVVSCRKPTLFYLFSGTYTTRYAYTLDDQELLADLEARKVDLVVLDQLGYSSTVRYLYPAIENNPERFDVILQIPNPDTYLLQFKK